MDEDKIISDMQPTEKQMKAIKSLERAFKKCLKEGIYIWHNYTSLEALNGSVVEDIFVPDGIGNNEHDLEVNSVGYSIKNTTMASNSDDTLAVVLTQRYKKDNEG